MEWLLLKFSKQIFMSLDMCLRTYSSAKIKIDSIDRIQYFEFRQLNLEAKIMEFGM